MMRMLGRFLAGAAMTAVGTLMAYFVFLAVSGIVSTIAGVNEANLVVLTIPLIPTAGALVWIGKVRRDMINLPMAFSIWEMVVAVWILIPVIVGFIAWFPRDFDF